MTKKQKALLEKRIRIILKEWKWESEWSTHSELAHFIIDDLPLTK